jgi:hypothetical protein
MTTATYEVLWFLGDVARAFTWRRWLLVEALFVVLDAVGSFRFGLSFGSAPLRLVIGHTMAYSMVLSVTIGDQAVARGVRTFVAYGLPLALMSYAGGQVQSWILIALDREPPEWEWLSVIDIGFELATYGAAFTLGYLDYHRRIELARRVSAAELTRARDEQQLVESRLAAARTELDPECLLDEIDELQRLFVADPARADAQLDDLIGRLREKIAPTSRHAASAV